MQNLKCKIIEKTTKKRPGGRFLLRLALGDGVGGDEGSADGSTRIKIGANGRRVGRADVGIRSRHKRRKGGNAGRKDALTEVARTGHRKAEVSALMPGAADKDYYCIWRMRQVRMKASRRE